MGLRSMSNWWMSQRAGSLWGETLDFESIEGRALLIMFEVVNDSLDPHEDPNFREVKTAVGENSTTGVTSPGRKMHRSG